jgi:N-acetylglutamate synthase-like GNAT family acetyltransferase
MDKFKIIEFDPTMTDQVISLILSIQVGEFGVSITKEDQPDLLNIPAFYQKGNGNFWCAILNDEVIGTISLLDIGNQEVALRKMFVKENARGKEKGVAKELLDTSIIWSKNKKVKTIYLGTTDKFKAAHRFYEKEGFEEISVTELPKRFPVMKVDSKFYKRKLG